MAETPQSIPLVEAGTLATATLRLTMGDLRIVHDVAVPQARVAASEAVPVLQGLVNAVVDAAERRSIAAGLAISCRKGCGACCRQLVPISRSEGERLLGVIEAMPAERRAGVGQRFAEAAAALDRVGLRETTGRSDREISAAYFTQRIPCPFLEDESCSIHAERPLVCREYLVTSPAALCAGERQEGVTLVAVPKFSAAARGLEEDGGAWFPLALLGEWAKTRPRGGAKRSGMGWLQRFLGGLSKPR